MGSLKTIRPSLILLRQAPVSHYRAGVLPRCMECRRGLATRKVSVCPSVRLSVKRVICDKTKEKKERKKVMPTFLYHVK